MSEDAAPLTFTEAIDWVGRRNGRYAMKMRGAEIEISVRVGTLSATVVAHSSSEGDLQAALIRAIGDLYVLGLSSG
jgi:hypothetical protein